jgi:hypothetical protein
VLFTADTLSIRRGEWREAVLGSSDPVEYGASLELMRELDFDVLAPWASDGAPIELVDARSARRRIDAALARVNAGRRVAA